MGTLRQQAHDVLGHCDHHEARKYVAIDRVKGKKATRAQYACDLGHGVAHACDVFKDVDANDRVKASIFEWQIGASACLVDATIA